MAPCMLREAPGPPDPERRGADQAQECKVDVAPSATAFEQALAFADLVAAVVEPFEVAAPQRFPRRLGLGAVETAGERLMAGSPCGNRRGRRRDRATQPR